MKKYAHIKDGNVVLVLEYKDTSNYIDENIIEFDDSIGIGAYKIENGKVVLDIETTMRIGLKIIIDISDYIYNFYTSKKQQQDEKWVSSYTTKLKAQGVENLELKVVEMITSFYEGKTLEEILSSVEDEQKPYFEKLVKVGIRTEWMEICINEGQTAIAEDREPNYPKFPTIN